MTLRAYTTSGLTLYAVLLDSSGQAWNGSAFEALLAGNWTTYALALTEATAGIYFGDMPAAAAGEYTYLVYTQAGGSPATSDVVRSGGSLGWNGSAEIMLFDQIDSIPANVAAEFASVGVVPINEDGAVYEDLIEAISGADSDTLETLSDQLDAVSTLISAELSNTSDSTASGAISRTRGNTWSISATIGAITGYTSLWFTVKHSKDDADADAILQIKKNASETGDGLIYKNGSDDVTAGNGSITVSDDSTGAIVTALVAADTDDMPVGEFYYDYQVKIGSTITTPDSGTFTVTADVTRSIT